MKSRTGRAWAVAVIVGVVVAGGGPVEAAAQRPVSSAPDAIELPAALDRVLRDYEAAWMAGDRVALADLFTDDGFVLRPGRPPARGREAILQAYAGAGGHLTLTAYGYASEGEVAYIIGGFAVLPGEPPVGKFVLALERDPSGPWRIVGDIDNGNG